MHAILIAIGSAGDVFPFIGLARTLKLRGHRVSLCTIPVFRDAVEQHGIAFVPLSDELTYRRTMGDPRLWDPKTSFGVLWQAIAGMIEPVYEYVSAQRHDDIVVVGSLWALGARIAHEKHGIPYLSAQVSPSTLLSAHLPPVHPKFNVPEQMPLAMRKLLWRCIERFKLDRTCAPEINAVRRKVGLETPVKRIFTQWMHSPQGVVCLFPAWFAPPQQDWPQPLHMTGFPLFDGSIPGTPLDDELQRFLDQGSRPLVFTQGSTEHLQGDFYAMALRALERLGARGIFLTGAGQEPLRGLPNHVLQRAYAPLGALLPSCAGLVHPGGIGAMSLALAAGVPQVLLPCAHDQFDHPQTRYIVAMSRQGICGCARLLPTTDAYLLKEVFAYLCSETPPSDPSVWELSRYAASAADDPQLAMKIFWSSLQCAWYLGASSVVAVTTTAMERYFVRNGVILQRLGPPQKVKGETLVAISFPAYQERGLEMLLRYHPEWLQGVPLSMAV